MSFKKLIIHPGIGKTATSAVQRYLYANSGKVVDDVRYVYPKHGLDSEFAHHYLSHNYPHYDEKEFEKHVANIICSAKKESGNCVYIISSEFFAHCDQEFINKFISKFREVFSEIKIIYAIRNYADLVYSSYLQAVKVNFGVVNGENIDDYSTRMGEGFSFPFLFSKWKGADSVVFLNYDRYKNNFLQNFVNACGMTVNIGSNGNKKINSSIIEDVVNIIFSFDSKNPTLDERKTFITNMVLFSDNYKKFKSTSMNEVLSSKYRATWEKDLFFLKNNFEEL